MTDSAVLNPYLPYEPYIPHAPSHMLCIQTIVIKIGSAVLANKNKSLNEKVLKHLAEQISKLYEEGHQILLVSSGAVAAGRGVKDFRDEKRRQVRKQMYAGLGQAKLMWKYHSVFSKHKIPISQCLITRDNFSDRVEFNKLIKTLESYLRFRVIPILNENDLVANNEVNFGGNDLLAALTAAAIRADKLIILSDIDALYDKDPHKNKDAKAIHIVEEIDRKIERMCGGSSSSIGIGGMILKIRAIKIATEAGVKTFMGKGTAKNILHDVVDTKKPVGTYFKPNSKKSSRFKNWLKYCSLPSGTITIDDGATEALKKRKSLLMVGIKEISDGIEAKDTVYIVDLHNNPIGTGKITFSSEAIKQAKKEKEKLGVIVHSDNISLN